jgi:hypothetical protein
MQDAPGIFPGASFKGEMAMSICNKNSLILALCLQFVGGSALGGGAYQCLLPNGEKVYQDHICSGQGVVTEKGAETVRERQKELKLMPPEAATQPKRHDAASQPYLDEDASAALLREIQPTQLEIDSRKAVLDRLKNPDEALFRNQKGACGEVNVLNVGGEYGGFRRFVYDHKQVYLEGSDDREGIIFWSLWNTVCR